jgi:hypothetical protein
VTKATPQVELLVTWSPDRQKLPRPLNTREMARLAPHSQISIVPSGRRHWLILRCLDASGGYQFLLEVSLRPSQRCPIPPLSGQRARAWIVSPSVCSSGRCSRSTIACLCRAGFFDPSSPLWDCVSLHNMPNMTLASPTSCFQNALSAWKKTGSKLASLHLCLLCPSGPERVPVSMWSQYNIYLSVLVIFDL